MNRCHRAALPVEQIDLGGDGIKAKAVITWPTAPDGTIRRLTINTTLSEVAMPCWIDLAGVLGAAGYQLTMSTEVREARIL